MKARQAEVVSALRTAIAAIDNAEAVEAPEAAPALASEHVAGARAGVGSTEAARRVLSLGEVRALLEAQISDRIAEAARYDALGQQLGKVGDTAALDALDRRYRARFRYALRPAW